MLHEVRMPVADGAQRQQAQCEPPLVRKVQPAAVTMLPYHAPPQRRRRHARRSKPLATPSPSPSSSSAAAAATSAIVAERRHALAHHVVESGLVIPPRLGPYVLHGLLPPPDEGARLATLATAMPRRRESVCSMCR